MFGVHVSLFGKEEAAAFSDGISIDYIVTLTLNLRPLMTPLGTWGFTNTFGSVYYIQLEAGLCARNNETTNVDSFN